jgi:hypothetical protein
VVVRQRRPLIVAQGIAEYWALFFSIRQVMSSSPSLDDPADPDVEKAWTQEIERRARELADESVQPVDWEVARERIARRLRERRR